MLDVNSLIEESFAALGNTPLEAINSALGQFMLTMFHPIISACCGISECCNEPQTPKEEWHVGAFSRVDVWCGNVSMRFSSNSNQIIHPTKWLPNIVDALKSTEIIKGYNWISLYYSRHHEDLANVSARLNNLKWNKGLETTIQLTWPQPQGFYGAKLFILLDK